MLACDLPEAGVRRVGDLPEAGVRRVGAIPTAAEPAGFWSGVAVWVDKPHVVNRRLTGAKEVARIWTNHRVISTMLQQPRVFAGLSEESLQKRLADMKMEGRNEAEGDDLELIIRDLLPRQLERAKVVREVVVLDHPRITAWFIPLGSSCHGDTESEQSYKSYRFVYSEDQTGKTIALDILSPPGGAAANSPDRNCSPGGAAVHTAEDDRKCSPGGAAVHSAEDDRKCSPGGAAVHSAEDDGICSPTTKWLCDHLLHKIAKWSADVAPGGRRRVQALVPIDRYNVLYQQLKRKYGRRMMQVWPDVTTTDPEKFVYEDIAIATYLLLLWEEERSRLRLEEKQSFVDLGCGNGLLVYILAQEGHPGKGIDVRKRTTWDIFGQGTVLQEEPITPSDSCLFPDSDWLIGNHSDELTPWIPVIAARSSYTTRYFVLPCCPFDFHGRFARTHTANSHYRNYLDYVCSIGQACGFTVEEDSLRIPSTKRICQIGRTRIYPEDEMQKIDQQISDFIISRPREQLKTPPKFQTERTGATTECLHGGRNMFIDDPSADSKLTSDQRRSKVDGTTANGSALWVDGFQPRSKVELVRNCNRLEEGLKERIVNTVGLALLNQTGPDSAAVLNQTGPDSAAVLNQTGTDSAAVLNQTGTDSAAVLNQTGTDSAAVLNQTGTDSAAVLNQTGTDSAAVLNQTGTDSAAVLNQTGTDSAAVLNQTGTDSAAVLNQTGTDSAAVLNQTGTVGAEEGRTDNRAWNKGGCLQMSEVVSMFDQETLQKLKCECGGLKTLLKNKNQVFVLRGDSVRLRDWSLEGEEAGKTVRSTNRKRGKKKKKTDRELRVKTSLCWFYLHHPGGCPRAAQHCHYAHGASDIRDKLQAPGPRAAQL
ncbi:putative tRNA (uracil-O(2)-)-methyltransferase isoform X2 [Branchiostoma floridae x Branchiostoma japonicum]